MDLDLIECIGQGGGIFKEGRGELDEELEGLGYFLVGLEILSKELDC